MVLLNACAEAILDDWMGGSRDGYHLMRARLQAETVITVLRQRGLLNEYGIAAAREELGDLELPLVPAPVDAPSPSGLPAKSS